MTSTLDYQALFAKSVATSPRAAAGQLYPYDFSASGNTGRNSIRLAYYYPLLHTIEEGSKRLAGVFAL